MQNDKTEITGNTHIFQIITRKLFNLLGTGASGGATLLHLNCESPTTIPSRAGCKLVPVHIVRGNIAYHRLGCLGLHQHIIAAHGHGQFKAGGSGQLL